MERCLPCANGKHERCLAGIAITIKSCDCCSQPKTKTIKRRPK